MPNIDSIRLKKKELLRFCPGSWLMPVMARNLRTKFGLNMTKGKGKGVIKVSPWLPWQLSYHNNEVNG